MSPQPQCGRAVLYRCKISNTTADPTHGHTPPRAHTECLHRHSERSSASPQDRHSVTTEAHNPPSHTPRRQHPSHQATTRDCAVPTDDPPREDQTTRTPPWSRTAGVCLGFTALPGPPGDGALGEQRLRAGEVALAAALQQRGARLGGRALQPPCALEVALAPAERHLPQPREQALVHIPGEPPAVHQHRHPADGAPPAPALPSRGLAQQLGCVEDPADALLVLVDGDAQREADGEEELEFQHVEPLEGHARVARPVLVGADHVIDKLAAQHDGHEEEQPERVRRELLVGLAQLVPLEVHEPARHAARRAQVAAQQPVDEDLGRQPRVFALAPHRGRRLAGRLRRVVVGSDDGVERLAEQHHEVVLHPRVCAHDPLEGIGVLPALHGHGVGMVLPVREPLQGVERLLVRPGLSEALLPLPLLLRGLCRWCGWLGRCECRGVLEAEPPPGL
mmetsp:Transcript_10387/g.25543  ORF Transcript_10387/g.25543 Transcript_10387/m.25543 type:complete len:450 (+) Transcript_10387:105-1454(+)|eukprot:CAMPEP_0206237700 /NCGR_PEP_ID=MMETSP0047_2-20121206/14407_1 /ASSEMBLY_ACC=CAM_ASM_000192 /TAXON_ID=195065 /ORGANISM="Chroomonas mesostigmatica_cf, Strain CCMP1168" /LENGTH=449 /DNA_ID=CAMNT_0053662157 /DNA_START=103 /DNA_END=1452 /DNA_ORIENTATION=-